MFLITIHFSLIKYLLERFSDSLEEIYISSRENKLLDEALVDLKNCKKLKTLLLTNIEFTQDVSFLFDDLDNLEKLMISYQRFNLNLNELAYIMDGCFTKLKPKLTSLNLKSFFVTTSFYENLNL